MACGGIDGVSELHATTASRTIAAMIRDDFRNSFVQEPLRP
jgi:hypothetical protein